MISVVIPVYNCSAALLPYIDQLAGVLRSRGETFQCILVDDGSAAQTREILLQLAVKPFVKVIRCHKNSGQQMATALGLKAACGDTIITLDDDCKHDLAIIPNLLDAVLDGYDIAFGIELEKKQASSRAFFSLPVSRLINRRFSMNTAYYVSSFRCFKRQLLAAANFSGDFFYTSCELLKSATSVANVFYEPLNRQPSRYKLRDKVRLFFNIVRTYGW